MAGLPVNQLLANAMKDSAEEASRNSSFHLARTYRKAWKSLSLYPLPIKTGRQARDLNGVGEFLEKQIDRWLANPAELYEFPTNASAARKLAAQSPRRSPKRKAPSSAAAPPAKHAAPEASEVAVPMPAAAGAASSKAYMPRAKSGAWALVMALFKAEKKGRTQSTKEELLAAARLLSEDKEEVPWSAMTTLVSKGLVLRTAQPLKYSLTDDGRATAQRLESLTMPPSPRRSSPTKGRPLADLPHDDAPSPKAARRDERVATVLYWFVSSSGSRVTRKDLAEVSLDGNELWVRIDSDGGPPAGTRTERRGDLTVMWMMDAIAPDTVSALPAVSARAPVGRPLPPPAPAAASGSPARKAKGKEKEKRAVKRSDARIVAVLDNREVRDKKDRAHIAEQLIKKGVECEVRALELGDVLWVVRRPGKADLVLDWILERKRVSDLESSIIDRRYTEQKFRLIKCGIKHIIYLVEGQLDKVRSLDPAAVQTAVASTQLEDRFIVVHTNSLASSIERIARVTERVEAEHQATDWEAEEARRPTLEQFMADASKSKNLSIRDLFAMQLLSITGLSPPKAAAITAKWATPALLLKAYADHAKPELMLQELEWQAGKRVGPALSKKVWEHFKSAVEDA